MRLKHVKSINIKEGNEALNVDLRSYPAYRFCTLEDDIKVVSANILLICMAGIVLLLGI